MKILNYCYLFSCLTLLFSSCKKSELTSFRAPAQIYFYDVEERTGKVRDSILISFARLGNAVKQIKLELPLEYIGVVSSSNRPFKLIIDKEKTTAIEGKHYILMPDDYQVMKNASKAILPIKIFSTPDLDNKTVQVVLKLQKNENFDTDFHFVNADLNVIDLSSYRIMISNMLLKPGWWDVSTERYLGSFSRKKVELIFDVTAKSLDDLEKARTMFNWDLFRAVARETQIHINYMRAVDLELKDETGQPINMGSYVN